MTPQAGCKRRGSLMWVCTSWTIWYRVWVWERDQELQWNPSFSNLCYCSLLILLTGYFGLEECSQLLLLAPTSPPVGAGGKEWDSTSQQGSQRRAHAVHAASLVCWNRGNSEGMWEQQLLHKIQFALFVGFFVLFCFFWKMQVLESRLLYLH